MLSTSYLLSQMDLLEAIKIENLVQSKVEFDSPILYYLNSYLLKTPEKELLKESFVNPQRLPIHDRFIYNCILEHYKLSAIDEKDQLLSEVYTALYVKEYANDLEKANALERLFHKMKKNNIEQEATPLLAQLWTLHAGKPLEAVYKHLYKKYSKIEKVNIKATKHFTALNQNLNNLLESDNRTQDYKLLIIEYKSIRKLHDDFENHNLTALLNFSKLILASICDQKQLLKENHQSIDDLMIECKSNLKLLPFGVERYYLTNILNQTKLFVHRESISPEALIQELKEKGTDANNFGFSKRVLEIVENTVIFNKKVKNQTKNINLNRVDKKLNHFVGKSFISLSIPRDSMLIRSNI